MATPQSLTVVAQAILLYDFLAEQFLSWERLTSEYRNRPPPSSLQVCPQGHILWPYLWRLLDRGHTCPEDLQQSNLLVTLLWAGRCSGDGILLVLSVRGKLTDVGSWATFPPSPLDGLFVFPLARHISPTVSPCVARSSL